MQDNISRAKALGCPSQHAGWRQFGLMLLAALMLASNQVRASEPVPQVTVVASIQPLYLMADEILGQSATVKRLLPPGASPHGFQLSVSERRLLDSADLVVWVGPQMESFLAPLIRKKPHLQADQLAKITRVDAPSDDQHGHHHDHPHSTGLDPHLWLDPYNGIAITEALVEQVMPLLKGDKAKRIVARNLALFRAKLQQADANWQAKLSGFNEQPWLVYHDALRHIQTHFGLMEYQIITVTPEKRPGAKHLYKLRKQLTEGQCLLVEDYYPTQQAQKLAQEFSLNLVAIDPLGVKASSYQALMQQLVDQLDHCFATAQFTNTHRH